MKKNMRLYGIIAMFVIMVGLLVFGVIYALNNFDTDVVKIDTSNIKYTISSDQLDDVRQPEVNVEVKYYILPEAKNTLEYIDVSTLKRLFQTDKKSIVVISDETCVNCKEYLPILTKALENAGTHAYVIDITKVEGEESDELRKYVKYDGTPTTYIIASSKVYHVLSGSVDDDTIKSFIDYFYLRDN